MRDISKLREEIDEIDIKIAELLKKRFKLVREISEIKIPSCMGIDDENRELEIFRNYKRFLEEIVSYKFIESFVKLLLNESKNIQRYHKKNISVALLGPEGTFSDEACERFFGNVNKVFCNSFEEIFDMVEDSNVNFGILPIENTLNGTIGIVLDLLIEKDVKISGEIVLNINLCLLSLENNLEDIDEIYSNAFALSQCKRFLHKYGFSVKEFSSTAEAARYVVENKLRRVGILGPKTLSEKYGLNVLAENVQDSKHNRTRFIIISKNFIPKPTGNDKTSIAISLEDKPGMLYKILKALADRSINLKRIESRFYNKMNDYIFFIDFEGHVEDYKIKEALDYIKNSSNYFKFLGSYKTVSSFV